MSTCAIAVTISDQIPSTRKASPQYDATNTMLHNGVKSGSSKTKITRLDPLRPRQDSPRSVAKTVESLEIYFFFLNKKYNLKQKNEINQIKCSTKTTSWYLNHHKLIIY